MRKISQRQLVEEGFGDIVRGAASAFMSTKLGQAIKSDLQPISDVVGSFKAQQPMSVLKNALTEKYYNVFNINTVKYGKEKKLQGDSKGNSRVAIEFTAKRINDVSTTGSGLQGGENAPEKYTAILTRTKKGSSGNYNIEIRDNSNKVIVGAKKTKKTKKSK